MWIKCDKGSIFKTKRFSIRKAAIKKNKYFFIIIITWDNEINFWSLVIANIIYNHLFTFSTTHPIYQEFAYIDTIKGFIVFQTRIKANSK